MGFEFYSIYESVSGAISRNLIETIIISLVIGFITWLIKHLKDKGLLVSKHIKLLDCNYENWHSFKELHMMVLTSSQQFNLVNPFKTNIAKDMFYSKVTSGIKHLKILMGILFSKMDTFIEKANSKQFDDFFKLIQFEIVIINGKIIDDYEKLWRGPKSDGGYEIPEKITGTFNMYHGRNVRILLNTLSVTVTDKCHLLQQVDECLSIDDLEKVSPAIKVMVLEKLNIKIPIFTASNGEKHQDFKIFKSLKIKDFEFVKKIIMVELFKNIMDIYVAIFKRALLDITVVCNSANGSLKGLTYINREGITYKNDGKCFVNYYEFIKKIKNNQIPSELTNEMSAKNLKIINGTFQRVLSESIIEDSKTDSDYNLTNSDENLNTDIIISDINNEIDFLEKRSKDPDRLLKYIEDLHVVINKMDKQKYIDMVENGIENGTVLPEIVDVLKANIASETFDEEDFKRFSNIRTKHLRNGDA